MLSQFPGQIQAIIKPLPQVDHKIRQIQNNTCKQVLVILEIGYYYLHVNLNMK